MGGRGAGRADGSRARRAGGRRAGGAALPGKTRKAAPRFATTAEGRRLALAALGVAELRPRTTWAVIRKTYLPAAALGLPASGEAALQGDGVRPGRPRRAAQTAVRAADRRGPQAGRRDRRPGLEADRLRGRARRSSTPRAVKAAILNRELGDGRAVRLQEGRRPPGRPRGRRTPRRRRRSCATPSCAAGSVRPPANRSGPPIGRLRPLANPGRRARASSIRLAPLDPAALAERVKAAARDCSTGRYGDHKVFIAHVWDRLRSAARLRRDGPRRLQAGAGRGQQPPAASTWPGPTWSRPWTPRRSSGPRSATSTPRSISSGSRMLAIARLIETSSWRFREPIRGDRTMATATTERPAGRRRRGPDARAARSARRTRPTRSTRSPTPARSVSPTRSTWGRSTGAPATCCGGWWAGCASRRAWPVGRMLLLLGEAGCGKTHLMRAFRNELHA